VETIPLLKKLTETPGLSGHEGPIREVVRGLWDPLVNEFREGGLGSLIGIKRGSGDEPRPTVMMAAHMDEIGLQVSGIEKGFLRVTRLGGTDRRVLPGLEVTVHGKKDLPGLVGMRPPHVIPRDKRKVPVPWDELFVDLGLSERRVRSQVEVGAPVSFRRELSELKGNLVANKALDNRASVAAVTLALEYLGKMDHTWDVAAVATVQEEVGLRGAITAAYGVAPELAVAVDVTFAKQPGFSGDWSYALGKGPTIGMGPNFHPQIVNLLKSTAESNDLPFHMEPAPGRSGTDAWAIQVSREGIPTGSISIPVRYMHQPVETVSVKDVERSARLMALFVTALEPDYRPTWEDETE
jgi:endoglucanase